jgi:hypothetical protein
MKRILTLLTVLILSLVISGCCPPIPKCDVVVNNVYHYAPCVKDTPPTYVQLNPENHLGSAENANILIGNLEIMQDYNKSLLNTIDNCYVPQEELINEPN